MVRSKQIARKSSGGHLPPRVLFPPVVPPPEVVVISDDEEEAPMLEKEEPMSMEDTVIVEDITGHEDDDDCITVCQCVRHSHIGNMHAMRCHGMARAPAHSLFVEMTSSSAGDEQPTCSTLT
jgi:hypothetical protein